jgi:ribonuclease HI
VYTFLCSGLRGVAALPTPLLFLIFNKTVSEIYCYTDGARGDYCSGIGYEIGGEVNHSGCRTLDGTYTSMEAELHALLEAVRVASVESDSVEAITVYTDCEPLVTKLTGPQNETGDWGDYRESAHWLLDKFDSWEVRHCSRQRTEKAHDLARVALREGRNS